MFRRVVLLGTATCLTVTVGILTGRHQGMTRGYQPSEMIAVVQEIDSYGLRLAPIGPDGRHQASVYLYMRLPEVDRYWANRTQVYSAFGWPVPPRALREGNRVVVTWAVVKAEHGSQSECGCDSLSVATVVQLSVEL